LKITQHNILAVACATLLLTLVFAPAHADARHKQPLRMPGPQYNVPTSAGYKHSGRTRYAQNEAGANTENGDKYTDPKKYKRAPRSSDSQSEAPTVSRSEAAAIAERATDGRVLSVRENGRYWQVKVLVDEKRVRFVNVDMRSGRVR
jgi:hypothetical protein